LINYYIIAIVILTTMAVTHFLKKYHESLPYHTTNLLYLSSPKLGPKTLEGNGHLVVIILVMTYRKRIAAPPLE